MDQMIISKYIDMIMNESNVSYNQLNNGKAMDVIYQDKEISCEDSMIITPEDEEDDEEDEEDENEIIDNGQMTPKYCMDDDNVDEFEHIENANIHKLESEQMNEVETWDLESIHDDEEIVGEDETEI